MSVTVVKNNIIMTRGDTLKLGIKIEDSKGEPYIPIEGDVIRFAVKENYNDELPCILKDIPYDTCILHLEPADTKELKQPCSYFYDIEITLSDGTVDTFIAGKLNIKEEVY